jgi:hypothetical protein
VAFSTCEVEYISACNAAWQCKRSMRIDVDEGIELTIDNKWDQVINLAKNPITQGGATI